MTEEWISLSLSRYIYITVKKEEDHIQQDWKLNGSTYTHTHTHTHICLKMMTTRKVKEHNNGWKYKSWKFTFMWNTNVKLDKKMQGYLRWWGKLFHAKKPEKEKLVLKIAILVLGKSCLFPWTRRHSEGIIRERQWEMVRVGAILSSWETTRDGLGWGDFLVS